MKLLKSVLVAFLAIFFSCSIEEAQSESELYGNWKLVAVLADPGDGSGTFRSVSSSKSIEFKKDGSFVSEGSLCYFTPESGQTGSGRFSVQEQLITPNGCNSPLVLSYKIENSNLLIYYPCIEPCIEKYTKID